MFDKTIKKYLAKRAKTDPETVSPMVVHELKGSWTAANGGLTKIDSQKTPFRAK